MPGLQRRALESESRARCGCTGKSRAQGADQRTRTASEAFPTIDFFGQASVEAAFEFFRKAEIHRARSRDRARYSAGNRERLKFLCEVGCDYLQLGRSVTTLSGGEAQRIRLAAQLGSNLSGVLYVLDEPTIGLHARDNEHLLARARTC